MPMIAIAVLAGLVVSLALWTLTKRRSVLLVGAACGVVVYVALPRVLDARDREHTVRACEAGDAGACERALAYGGDAAKIAREKLDATAVVLTQIVDLRVSAASGVSLLKDTLYVATDDQNYLITVQGTRVSRVQVFEGELPADPVDRKRKKPDLESITALAPDTLLALGSGSTPARERGILLGMTTHIIDLAPLYAALREQLPELNIEGAAVVDDELRLFQRGNGGKGDNAMIRLALGKVQQGLALGRLPADAVISITHITLGALEGVPLSLTDATALPDGRLLFTAAAEATTSVYDDGAIKGSVVGMMQSDGTVLSTRRLSPRMKAEGILVFPRDDGHIELLIVDDPDDPSASSSLYRGTL